MRGEMILELIGVDLKDNAKKEKLNAILGKVAAVPVKHDKYVNEEEKRSII